MKKQFLFPGLLAVAGLFSLAACNKDDNNGNSAGTASVGVRLTDAPADYDHIYLDVQGVEISNSAGAWTPLPLVRTGLYDILRFRNGADTLLGRVTMPAGRLSEMRLLLGENSTIVVDGTTYPLKVPSGTTSGWKMKMDDTLVAGGSYDYWLDFDAAKSVVETGNGKYILKPVVRAYTQATNGKIRGYVLPGAAQPTIYAIQGTDTFSAIPDATTFYQFSGLPSGTYSVWFDGQNGYQDTMLTGINVTYGQITDLGTYVLHL